MKKLMLVAIGLCTITVCATTVTMSREELDNAKELQKWMRNKKGQTALARDYAFEKIKGKTIVWKGKVRQIGKTFFGDKPYVSLWDASKDFSVHFNVKESFVEQLLEWKIDEEHTLRGKVAGQGDIMDDARCDEAENVGGSVSLHVLDNRKEESSMVSEVLTGEEKSARDLLVWMQNKEGQTDMAKDHAFEKVKGKSIMWKGKVRQIGKTFFGDKPYVSLYDALGNKSVQFNVKESCVEQLLEWKIGEEHTLRGLVSGQGDFEDDASCDNAEIVK